MSYRCRVPLLIAGLVLGCAPYAGSADADEVTDPEFADVPDAELEPDALEQSPAQSRRRCAVERLEATPVAEAEGFDRGSLRVRRGDALLELPIQETTFESNVLGTIVETDVVQVFSNPFDIPIEAVYTFPLPEDGAVDDYWIRIGERTIHGTMKRRDEARATYEEAKQRGYRTALLEQERPNLFTQSVANIGPGETIEVQMHIVAPLERENGRYRMVLPTVVGPRFVPGVPKGRTGGGFAPDTDRVPDGSKVTPRVLPPGLHGCASVHVSVDIETGFTIEDIRSKFHAISGHGANGVTTVELSRTDEIPNRDFELSWAVRATEPQAALMVQRQGDASFFTLTVEPPAAATEMAPRDLIFVVDTSGSMDGVPIETAKRTVSHALQKMRPDDAFQIIRFSDAASGLAAEPLLNTPSNRAKGLRYIQQLDGEGGTHMLAGIEAALRQPRTRGRIPIVLFLTDGYIGNEVDAFAAVERNLNGARLFSLGVGSSVNRHLLDGLAKMGRGAVTYMGPGEAPDEVVERFYDRIARPALTDLRIDWGGLAVSDVTPAELPDLFVGQSLTVFGRYHGAANGRATLKGRAGEREVAIPIVVDIDNPAGETSALASVWARHRIDDLLRSPEYYRADEAARTTRHEQATELALAHRVLTEFTAFVAVDEQRVANPDGTYHTVHVPVEMPEGVAYERILGSGGLGIVGTGRGGGGTGLGTIGLIGHGGGGGVGIGYGRGAGFAGRGTSVPMVRAVKPIVTGSLDRDIIRRIVRAHIIEVRYCYNQALVHDPKIAGRVEIEFEIASHGAVTSAKVAKSSLPEVDHGTAQCIAKQVAKWKFPSGPGVVRVTYPFVLERN